MFLTFSVFFGKIPFFVASLTYLPDESIIIVFICYGKLCLESYYELMDLLAYYNVTYYAFLSYLQ